MRPPHLTLGLPRCLGFGGSRIDAAIAGEFLRALEPMAIEASREAERIHMQAESERRRVAELELQQARYEASLAERRYAACDPDNRLIAAQLERSSETALQRVEACQARLDARDATAAMVDWPDFAGLAEDLAAAWNAPGTMMRTRQRLVRALITDIVADVDEKTREVVLVIHWKGGQHSELRVRKPKTGEHGCKTPEDALAVMRSMAARWSDEDIAASLNRMGMRTGAALVHVIDSTGLRLGRPPGSGGKGWRKLHIGVDPDSGRMLAEELTGSDVHDAAPVPAMLHAIGLRTGRSESECARR